MNKIMPFYKVSLRSYFIEPLFYVSSIIMILFCAFRFFFVSKFFVAGIGSADLRPLFNSVPYISIIALPLLVFRLRNFILDNSVPLAPFLRSFSISLSAFTASFIPVLIVFIFVPVSIFFFGDLDFGQLFTGLFGIVLYLFCAVSLAALAFSFCKTSSALGILLSSVFLAATTFIHLLPLSLDLGDFLSFLCRLFSFSWHFDSFSKGILDSRSVFFFLCASFVLILLSSSCEYKRLSKKTDRLTLFLFLATLILLSASVSRLYFCLDFSSSKQFSVSKTSRKLLESLSEENSSTLRITYFRSKELKNLYPQIGDVSEFLTEYSMVSPKVTLNIQKADSEKLKALGIQGQQIKSSNGAKTEYTTVFSAVLLQYGEKSSIIPFVLSTQTLEYDLSQRVQSLVTGKERTVYLLPGNGRSISESYVYVEPWLNSRGFRAVTVEKSNEKAIFENLSSDDVLAVFGSDKIDIETESLLESALDKGAKAFVMASPFSTTIEDEWKITKSQGNRFLSYLNSKGFAFKNALAEDISCFPLTMASGEGSNAEYVVINYPLWLSLQSQAEAKNGLTLFWTSPLDLYNGVEPVLFTTKYAWLQENAQAAAAESLFLTDPFTIPKTAKAAGKTAAQYIVGAKNKNIILISDQFFLSSLMTGFISGENSIDFRNYDFFVSQILKLRGESELASLMEKSQAANSLYKITDAGEFNSKKNLSIFLSFIVPVAVILGFAFSTVIFRIKKVKKYEN